MIAFFSEISLVVTLEHFVLFAQQPDILVIFGIRKEKKNIPKITGGFED